MIEVNPDLFVFCFKARKHEKEEAFAVCTLAKESGHFANKKKTNAISYKLRKKPFDLFSENTCRSFSKSPRSYAVCSTIIGQIKICMKSCCPVVASDHDIDHDLTWTVCLASFKQRFVQTFQQKRLSLSLSFVNSKLFIWFIDFQVKLIFISWFVCPHQ